MLADSFVHRHRGAKHTCANICTILDFEQALDGSILTEGSMQDRENYINRSNALKLIFLADVQMGLATVIEYQRFVERFVVAFAESLVCV